MKLISAFLLASFCYGAVIMSGGASSNGVWVNYETKLEPGSPALARHGGGTLNEGAGSQEQNIIKRHICNFDNNTYFGYDLTIEPLADGQYRLRFGSLTISPQKMNEIFERTARWTQLSVPNATAAMQVRAGETVALDLFVNPSTGQKITDYLTVRADGRREQAQVTGSAHDFSSEDAEIAVISPEVTVDGKVLVSSPIGISGQAVWIDIPGQGRFVFSLSPRPDLGMQMAGEIRGSAMTWHMEGHAYAIAAGRTITSGSRAYNLYVFHVPRSVEHFGMAAGRTPDAPIRGK